MATLPPIFRQSQRTQNYRVGDSTYRLLTKILAEITSIVGVNAEDTLDDLGVDSLDRQELILAIEDRFDIVFDEDQFEILDLTLGDIANRIDDLVVIHKRECVRLKEEGLQRGQFSIPS